MGYTGHSRHKTPADRQKIWRYMDFTKYVDMLEDGSLFFPNISVLCMQDPYEGTFYNFTGKKLRKQFKEDKDSAKIFQAVDTYNWQNVYVNCWHMNNAESAALWKLYMKSNDGIAIVSSVKRLKSSLGTSLERVYVARISYGTKRRLGTPVPDGKRRQFNISDCALFKRASFSHEREVRAFVLKSELPHGSIVSLDGLRVKVNIDELVSKIVINPESPTWVEELVRKISKRYGFDFEIVRSTLNKPPLELR